MPNERHGALTEAATLALCVALLTASSWLGELITTQAPSGLGRVSLLSDGAVCMTYLAFCVFHGRVDGLWRQMSSGTVRVGRIALVLAALGVAGGACRGVACALGTTAPLARDICQALYEACRAALLMATLCACAWRAPRWAALAIPAGYAGASALVFILRSLPVAVTVGAATLVLPVAGLALAAMATRARDEGQAPGAEDAPAENDGPRRWTFPLRPVVLMCTYAFAFRFSIFLSEGPNPYGMLGMLLVSVAALGAAARLGERAAAGLYKAALPMMVAGLVCLAFLGQGRTVAVLFASSGNVAFTLFMYVTLASVCNRYAVSPAWLFGVVQLASEMAGVAGMAAGMSFTAAYPAGSEAANLVMCCMVVGVTVASTIVFNDAVAARSFGIAPVGPARPGTDGAASGEQATMSYSERIVWQCTRLARRYGLTLREQEVFELMAQGLSVPGIAERVGVSYGTAKTHVGHIYRKLDVHTRDEALALLHRE